MSYKRISPTPVVEGGSGAQTLTGVLTGNGTSAFTANAVTQHGVVVGGSSNGVGSTAVGSAGEVLTSNGAGNDPTFQAAATGDVTGPGSSTDRAVATWNGTGGNALFDNSTFTVSSGGVWTNTAQPAFEVNTSGIITDVTGDGTLYTIVFGTTVFDTASAFSSTTYTTPEAGVWVFSAAIALQDLGAGHTLGFGIINAGANHVIWDGSPGACRGSDNTFHFSGSCIVSLAASTACTVQVNVFNSTKTVDIRSGLACRFSGFKLA